MTKTPASFVTVRKWLNCETIKNIQKHPFNTGCFFVWFSVKNINLQKFILNINISILKVLISNIKWKKKIKNWLSF